MMKKIKVIYIHGTNGQHSSKSDKLRTMLDEYKYDVIHFKQDLKSPLNTFNRLSEYIEELYKDPEERVFLVGSSRGGLIAFILMQKYDIPGLLFNPLLQEVDQLVPNEGETEEETNRINNEIRMLLNDIDEWEYNYFITNMILSKNDELIDHDLTTKRFPHMRRTITVEDDHRLSKFDDYSDIISEIIGIYFTFTVVSR